MAQCKMIPFEQMLEWQKQDEQFQPLPVWLEYNKRYKEHIKVKFEATAIIGIDGQEDFEDPDVYMENGAALELTSYNKSWRLWYACGAEIPAFDEELWERFSWDQEVIHA